MIGGQRNTKGLEGSRISPASTASLAIVFMVRMLSVSAAGMSGCEPAIRSRYAR
jgi:hypothetical protein